MMSRYHVQITITIPFNIEAPTVADAGVNAGNRVRQQLAHTDLPGDWRMTRLNIQRGDERDDAQP